MYRAVVAVDKEEAAKASHASIQASNAASGDCCFVAMAMVEKEDEAVRGVLDRNLLIESRLL